LKKGVVGALNSKSSMDVRGLEEKNARMARKETS